MRAKEFIQDSVLDNMVAQVKQPAPAQPKLPYNQSKVGNFVGKTVAGAANLAGQGIQGLSGALGAGFNKSLAGGYSFGAGPGGGTVAGGIPFKDGQIDPKVADYIKKASKGQPVANKTGNDGIDTLLKNAGLLK